MFFSWFVLIVPLSPWEVWLSNSDNVTNINARLLRNKGTSIDEIPIDKIGQKQYYHSSLHELVDKSKLR